jgi:uncharacterized LabA/DUF88 family protein
MAERTIVYVDGFNLYYGSLKNTAYKWLDLEALFTALLPQQDLVMIRYFTAKVSGVLDPDAPTRQQTYLRALGTLPKVSVHFGNFLTNNTYMPLTTPPAKGSRKVQVIKREEKGSDVNLACHLLVDGFKGRANTAVIVSNDSDFCEPVIVARSEIGMRVGIINPHPKWKRSRTLSQDAHFVKEEISPRILAASQFPKTLIDSQGKFHKPTRWP